jgi:hypothetical protein
MDGLIKRYKYDLIMKSKRFFALRKFNFLKFDLV